MRYIPIKLTIWDLYTCTQVLKISKSTYKEYAAYKKDSNIYTKGYQYVADNYAWDAAGWFWTKYKHIDDLINSGTTVEAVTRKVNGGTRLLAKRTSAYNQLSSLLSNYID